MTNENHAPFNPGRPRRWLACCFAAAFLAVPGAAIADEGLQSLMTETPEEGFDLAVKLAQKGVATTQPDAQVRAALRGDYAHDADSLIQASHVVAIHFQTIAEANDHWREE
jgi:hypothetical protein